MTVSAGYASAVPASTQYRRFQSTRICPAAMNGAIAAPRFSAIRIIENAMTRCSLGTSSLSIIAAGAKPR